MSKLNHAKLIIHRDTEKIGGSVVELISNNGSRIIIDAGVPLLEDDGSMLDFDKYKSKSVKELIDLGIIPYVNGLYKNINSKNKSAIDGILISHAHRDHYGLIQYIKDDLKYYLTEATHKLIDITTLFSDSKIEIDNYQYINSGQPFTIKDFKITPYFMNHSGFDSQAFLIEADGKNLVYTGDFRGHGRKNTLEYFFRNLPEKIDGLIMEGSNIGNENKTEKPEASLEAEIEKVLAEPGLVLFTASGQNVDRIISFYRAARKTERIFLIDFYTANILDIIKDHAEIPYPSSKFSDVKVYYPEFLTEKIFNMNQEELAYKFSDYKMEKEEIVAHRNKLLMLVRNSTVHDLNKISDLEKDIFKKASFIYSRWPEYLEKGKFKNLQNFIDENNMKFHKIYTSGHADIKTSAKVVDKLKPAKLFPIHTLNPEEYNQFNADVKKLENSEVYEL